MSDTTWMIKGREFVNCNCAYGCPCQFNALPTHGDCKAVACFAITEGHHGDTRLDGLNAVGVLASLASPLAKAEISLLAVATHDTDYRLVKAGALASAVAALTLAGHHQV